MALLNTATSIVDFLKSQGKPSDFASRKSIYDTSGLASAFGDYRGTSEQNVTLLKKLSTPTVSPTLTPTTEPKPTAKDVVDQTTPTTISSAFDLEKSDADKALEEEKKGLTFDLSGVATRGAEELQRGVETLKRTAGEQAAELATKGAQEIIKTGEQFAAAGLFRSGKREKSQAEIAQEVATKQSSIQAKLGDQLYNTFTDFEKNYGTKFLESLSIPEAQQFTKLPAPVRGIVMQNYQEAISKAEDKAQKNALSTLEKLGYTVVGGQIVQTLAGRSAERAEEAGVRAEQRLTLAEQAGQRAEEAARRAEAKAVLDLGGTKTDREARLFDDISLAAGKDLEANKGSDNYVNADAYVKYREQVKKSAPTKVDDFDKNFALRLNPADAIRLGINQAKFRTSNKLDSLIEALQSQ